MDPMRTFILAALNLSNYIPGADLIIVCEGKCTLAESRDGLDNDLVRDAEFILASELIRRISMEDDPMETDLGASGSRSRENDSSDSSAADHSDEVVVRLKGHHRADGQDGGTKTTGSTNNIEMESAATRDGPTESSESYYSLFGKAFGEALDRGEKKALSKIAWQPEQRQRVHETIEKMRSASGKW